MVSANATQINERGSFAQEWAPHQIPFDAWRANGFLHDANNINRLFAYQVALNKFEDSITKSYDLQILLCDITNNKNYYQRSFVPIARAKKFMMDIDEDSIIIGEQTHVLNDKRAIALRVRQDEFAFDLCLTKQRPLIWHGRDGVVAFGQPNTATKRNLIASFSGLQSYGRLNIANESMRVLGRSSFERSWGDSPLKVVEDHWEKLHLFFFDGREVSIVNFPRREYKDIMFFDQEGHSSSLNTSAITATNFAETKGWSFAAAWTFNLSEDLQQQYTITTLYTDLFKIPYCEIAVAIRDVHGNVVGYGFAELLPGARNSSNRLTGFLFK